MSAVNGRLDDMLIIRGVNLYPTEVERVVLGMGELGPNYQLVVERPATMDELTIICEVASSEIDAALVRPKVARAVQQAIGLSVQVDVLPPGGIARSEGKAVRVVDRRQR
jgi:phenylacetate-CoA ligase